jgi:hypothetical protein
MSVNSVHEGNQLRLATLSITQQEPIIDQKKSNVDLAERLWFDSYPVSNLILLTEIEIQFVFLDEWRKLPWIQQCDLAVHVVI